MWVIERRRYRLHHDTDSDADHDNLFGSTLANRNLQGGPMEVVALCIAGLAGDFRGRYGRPPAQ
jgi:hypothetical protein